MELSDRTITDEYRNTNTTITIGENAKDIVTSNKDERTTYPIQDYTTIDKGVPVYSAESTINHSKPWRQVIKRRVIDGGDNNESSDL